MESSEISSEFDFTCILDGKDLESLPNIHERLCAELHFPDYYGRNLDALQDCLTDPGVKRKVTVVRKTRLKQSLGKKGRALLAVMEEASSENPDFVLEYRRSLP